MSPRELPFKVFDADNHLYETQGSADEVPADRHKGAIDYVDVRGRTKIVVRGQISEYIPNPTFERRRPARRPGGLLPPRQPRRQELPRDLRRADAGHPRLPRAGAAARADGRAGHRPRADVPDPGQPGRGADAGRSRDDPRRRSTPSTSGCTRPGSSTTRTASSPRRSSPCRSSRRRIEELEWCVERGARTVLIRPAPVPGFRGTRSFGLPEFDPFWEKVVEHDIPVAMHASDSGYERYINDWMGSGSEFLPFKPQAVPDASRWASARSRTPWPRWSATARCPASRSCGRCRSRTAQLGA